MDLLNYIKKQKAFLENELTTVSKLEKKTIENELSELNNLQYKLDTAKEFDEVFDEVIFKKKQGNLNTLLSPDTLYYFEQFDEQIIERTEEHIEDLICEDDKEDQDTIKNLKKFLKEFCEKSNFDHSQETTNFILEEYEFFREYHLQEDIEEIKENLGIEDE